MIGRSYKLLFVASCYYASVVESFAVVKRTTKTKPQQPLRMMDPMHLADGIAAAASSVNLADAAAAVSAPPEAGGLSYSRASYYTVLGLYLISFPGLWSTIKRSTTAKVKRRTFVSPGENADADAVAAAAAAAAAMAPPVTEAAVGEDSEQDAAKESGGGKSLRQQAGEIMAYMKANNYEVIDAGETITFRGVVPRSLSQAFFLTFCTALGMLSLALVLQIQFQDLELPVFGKPNWFLLAFLSPYAGLYYWRAGDRVDDCTVKLSANEDETVNEIVVQGSEEELDRMWRTLGWQEKGMVKIDGLLDGISSTGAAAASASENPTTAVRQ